MGWKTYIFVVFDGLGIPGPLKKNPAQTFSNYTPRDLVSGAGSRILQACIELLLSE